ncbi:transcription factor bHLH112-like isoform X2 [Phalaenopsis equestris]|uniref:transcription factor bHLH112-like isoform X2 n=1 Tax=Phalaenopsis equestris TaxID=78828 RepID=UPI0009E34C7A|nr:transcription factor bHLH112-like isoform X2 [Phalaenopsis equestris]
MADEFHGLSGSWWSSMRCSSVKEPQDLCFGWAQSLAADGIAGCSFDNSPASCVTFQGIPAMDSSCQLSISDLSPSSVDQWAQSFIAEGSDEPYANLKDTSQGFLTIDPSSSESAMTNLPVLSPSGFSLLDNLLAFEARPHQQDNSGKNTSSDFCSLVEPLQFMDAGFEEKSYLNKSELNSEENTSSSNSSRSKKPRIATPSPLPTFKVRKEKLGDRVTALQQLVSPFGKTDTASVLQEAIEYIKFLHDQVRTLSSPYLRTGSQINQQQNSERSKDSEGRKQQLRSRGLCLVPISSTFAVACSNIPPIDFWTPPFGMFSYT